MSTPTPTLEIAGSRNFTAWLREQRASIAFTTYQTGKLFLIGLREEGKLSVFERTFERCMGLAVSPDAQTLWMSSVYQLWRFENALPAGTTAPGGSIDFTSRSSLTPPAMWMPTTSLSTAVDAPFL